MVTEVLALAKADHLQAQKKDQDGKTILIPFFVLDGTS